MSKEDSTRLAVETNEVNWRWRTKEIVTYLKKLRITVPELSIVSVGPYNKALSHTIQYALEFPSTIIDLLVVDIDQRRLHNDGQSTFATAPNIRSLRLAYGDINVIDVPKSGVKIFDWSNSWRWNPSAVVSNHRLFSAGLTLHCVSDFLEGPLSKVIEEREQTESFRILAGTDTLVDPRTPSGRRELGSLHALVTTDYSIIQSAAQVIRLLNCAQKSDKTLV